LSTRQFFRAFFAGSVALTMLAGCGEHGHEHAKSGEHSHAAGAAHGPAGEKLTHFTEYTELFVEFPRLTVGDTSVFAAHVTRLDQFKAVTSGQVKVILSGGGPPDETFTAQSPAQPGIFRPQVSPQHAGEREMAIEVATGDFTARHVLGPVTVFADRKAAAAAPSEPEDPSEIGFTKEQQWKVDFATAPVQSRTIRSAVSATGKLRARADGEALLTAQTAGQLRAAGGFPYPGQTVQQGAVLAYLLPRLGGDTDVATLQAASRKARVELEQATRERTRMESLYRDEAVPEKRLLAARAAETSAQVDYETSQQRLNQFAGAGGGVPIRAPVSGAIADTRVTPGAYVQEGQLLFHIVDRGSLWLELHVAEADAARVTAPSGVAFRVHGHDGAFELVPGKNGRLIAAGAIVDPITRTLPVVFELAKPNPGLRIGMAVSAQVFAGDARQALAVPAEAIVDDSGIPVIFVQTGGESFQRQPVRLGARDGDWVEIVDGLTAGQRVVTRGAYLVKLASTRTGAIGHGHAH
jgi:RND family efflux transporter MFP subunit